MNSVCVLQLGRGHSRIFLLRESWSSGMEHFREFGIPEKSGNRIFGNSVFPFGITEFSGFPNYWLILKSFLKNFKRNFFFQNFQKKVPFFFLVFLFSNIEFSGFPCIFGIPMHFRNSRATTYTTLESGINVAPWINIAPCKIWQKE